MYILHKELLLTKIPELTSVLYHGSMLVQAVVMVTTVLIGNGHFDSRQ